MEQKEIVFLRQFQLGITKYTEFMCFCGEVFKTRSQRSHKIKKDKCNCVRRKAISKARIGHGLADSCEYNTWLNVKARCLNPKIPGFSDYGGRNIKMCDEWINSFQKFYEDMGPRPSKFHSIDRIDNNAGYSKENCRWADRKTQNNNTRANAIIEFNGEKLSRSNFCEKYGLEYGMTKSRQYSGWPVERLFEPKKS